MLLPEDDKKYLYVVYMLQALSFVLLITAPIGLILNYIKCDDYRHSWLESHCLWQKNTFWFGLLWLILGGLTTFFLIGYIVLFFLTFWLIYRIARGWIYLSDDKAMYQS